MSEPGAFIRRKGAPAARSDDHARAPGAEDMRAQVRARHAARAGDRGPTLCAIGPPTARRGPSRARRLRTGARPQPRSRAGASRSRMPGGQFRRPAAVVRRRDRQRADRRHDSATRRCPRPGVHAPCRPNRCRGGGSYAVRPRRKPEISKSRLHEAVALESAARTRTYFLVLPPISVDINAPRADHEHWRREIWPT
jgi:hypothetical protein